MISFLNVTKRYGNRTALSHFSLRVPQGQILGLLGQNGAGKSTAMNIMTGCLPPTEGNVVIGGCDMMEYPREAKKLIGYLPEQAPLYDEMTVHDYLSFVCRLRKMKEKEIADEVNLLSEKTGLKDVLFRRIGNLSKGYRQRVGLSQALCGNPQVIVLDEPTAGLDPVQAVEFRRLILSLAREHTVIFSSHILSDVQSVCDRAIILNQGECVADRMLGEKNGSFYQLRAVIEADKNRILPALRSLKVFSKVELLPSSEKNTVSVLLHAKEGTQPEKALFTLLSGLQCPLLRLIPVEDSLEDIFLHAAHHNISKDD